MTKNSGVVNSPKAAIPMTQPKERSAREDRHIGITLVFTSDEHARLHLLAKYRHVTYSHLLRSLLIEECNRVWPQGISRALLDSAEVGRHTERAAKKRYAREKEAERLRKAADVAREKVLRIEEELRRTKRKQLPEPIERVLPALSPNPKVEAWLEERAVERARVEEVRATYKPRVRSR